LTAGSLWKMADRWISKGDLIWHWFSCLETWRIQTWTLGEKPYWNSTTRLWIKWCSYLRKSHSLVCYQCKYL